MIETIPPKKILLVSLFFHNERQVRFFHAAIGPQPDEAVIHVSAADDSSSLLPISDVQERFFPDTGEVATEKIRVGKLADFVSAEDIKVPALLKLDVQGFELEALKGCACLLDRFAQVCVECSKFYPFQLKETLGKICHPFFNQMPSKRFWVNFGCFKQ